MKASRDKGAAFERDVARMLHAELGIGFRRNLDQYQARDLGDLTPDDDAFPFLIECKAYARGTDCKPAWMEQARKAADGTGLYPCVVWKFDRHPIRCRVPVAALFEAVGSRLKMEFAADLTVEALAMLAREIMARRAEVYAP